MSLSTHCAHLRNGTKMGDMKLKDTMITDGLNDAFYGYHMGITAGIIIKAITKARAMPMVIIQPKSITGLILLTTKEVKATIVVRTV